MRRLALLLLIAASLACASAPPRPAGAVSGICPEQAEPSAVTFEGRDDIVRPEALRRVEPLAPATLLGREAVATIEAVIGEDGTPRHICQVSGDPEWGAQLIAAFGQWRFKPATRDGKPIAVRFTLTSRFTG